MTALEKGFVNAAGHSRRVADGALRLLAEAGAGDGLKLLDVGCGNGAVLRAAAEAFGLEGVGIDLDPDQIALAHERRGGLCGVDFRIGDAARLPLDSETFDIVFSNKTTHHMPNWRRAVEEMARVLKPEGRLVYDDFAAPALLAKIGPRLFPSYGFPTAAGVREAAARAGLEELRFEQRGWMLEALWVKTG